MNHRRGVTLMEMLIVVALIGLMVGITFPSVSSGVDSLRLLSASDAVASFLSAALNRAERRQQVMEVSFAVNEGKLTMRSGDPGFLRELQLPDGVRIIKLTPDTPRVLLYPGGSVPRIAVELENRRRARKQVLVDPITGVPEVLTLPNAVDEEAAK
jgi:prepilin-type N-terminal cleavage/methylation domain-containing protein